MSHRHVQQLSQVEQSFLAVQQAVRQALTDPSQPEHGSLLRASQDLETTYVTRLFSQFAFLSLKFCCVPISTLTAPGTVFPRTSAPSFTGSLCFMGCLM